MLSFQLLLIEAVTSRVGVDVVWSTHSQLFLFFPELQNLGLCVSWWFLACSYQNACMLVFTAGLSS